MELFEALQSSANFSIEEVPDATLNTLTKMPASQFEKAQMSSLFQQLPMAAASKSMTGMYRVEFPEGLPNTLTKLRQGGFGSMIKDPETGKFLGTASLYNMSTQAAVLGAFTAMSAVTGQYFLAEINESLSVIGHKVDQILEFLYGEKKAELLAEIRFIQYAHKNFASIMRSEPQRMATIVSLQEAKKVAMKDIDFYSNDLDGTVNAEAKNEAELGNVTTKAAKIFDSIDLSIQLYAAACLLEVCFSQNTDPSYIAYVESDLTSYIDKNDKHSIYDLSALKTRINEFKTGGPMKKAIDKMPLLKELDPRIERIQSVLTDNRYKEIRQALHSLNDPVTYLVDADGNMYRDDHST